MAQTAKNTEHKLVHLDLKGAPPKVSYLEEIFPQFHRWGATGLLLEYEDMFPYEGDVSEIAAPDAYSREDIERILQAAAENDMIVIPLVQTFGHLEFVLKHEKFRTLREVPTYPMALCPSNKNSLTAIKMMIDQVMEVHSNSQFFHIGADEVYHIGVCEKCKTRISLENLTPQELFFKHVKDIVSYIKERYPSLTIIMWDDMLRSADMALLKDSGLSGIVEPMVWHYLKSFMLPPDIWQKFSSVFPTVWFASAFKGATGSSTYVTNISYHTENHLAWLSVLDDVKSIFQTIRGFAITGWQRYDHYAVLCELLPQSLPSLGVMLSILNKGMFCEETLFSVSKDLNFLSPLTFNPFINKEIPSCSFPGSDIYRDMLFFLQLDAAYEEFTHSDRYFTWMNGYLMSTNFANPVHLEPLLVQSQRLLTEFQHLRTRLQISLQKIFFEKTVIEWTSVFLEPKIKKLSEVVEVAQGLLQREVNAMEESTQ